MAKPLKKKQQPVLDPPRCSICGTSVTLYPPGWVICPACGRPVCRQCWGPHWETKAFDPAQCCHKDGSAGPAVVPIGEKIKPLSIPDWTSYLISGGLVLLGLLAVYLLWDLFF